MLAWKFPLHIYINIYKTCCSFPIPCSPQTVPLTCILGHYAIQSARHSCSAKTNLWFFCQLLLALSTLEQGCQNFAVNPGHQRRWIFSRSSLIPSPLSNTMYCMRKDGKHEWKLSVNFLICPSKSCCVWLWLVEDDSL